MSVKTVKTCDWCDRTPEEAGTPGSDWRSITVRRVGDTTGNDNQEFDCCPRCWMHVEGMRPVRAAEPEVTP